MEKTRRAKGVLQWQLEQGRAVKIRRLDKLISQIKDTLQLVSVKQRALSNARHQSQSRFFGFQEKVDQNKVKLTGLRKKIMAQIDIVAIQLKSQILAVLATRKQALNHYLLQSDLSVARLHEQAVKIPEME